VSSLITLSYVWLYWYVDDFRHIMWGDWRMVKFLIAVTIVASHLRFALVLERYHDFIHAFILLLWLWYEPSRNCCQCSWNPFV
jgi:hypothetical protein